MRRPFGSERSRYLICGIFTCADTPAVANAIHAQVTRAKVKRFILVSCLLIERSSIEIKWIAVNLRIFFGFLLRFLKLLFEQPAAIFEGSHLLRKHLVARLLLLVEVLD